MNICQPPWLPIQTWSPGQWDAERLSDRAEVAVCREILGRPEPSWWAVAREYVERFNEEHPIKETSPD